MIGSLTVFTSTEPPQLGKVYRLQDDKLHKTVAGNMFEGKYDVRTFDCPDAYADLLTTIGTNQAISNSLPRNGEPMGRIVTADRAVAEKCLARTKDDFHLTLGHATTLPLDYDPAPHAQPLSQGELWNILIRMCPAAATAGAVSWCSASSHIHGPDGELQGLKGQRIYLFIQDASDIPRVGKVIAGRCWLNGLGRVEVSKSGQRLMRSLFDEAMFQPARLDFIGGAICEPPLFQQRGSPVLLGGSEWLDTRAAFPDLTDAECAIVEQLQRDAMDKVQPLVDERREQWIVSRAQIEATRLQRDKKMPKAEAIEQGQRLAESALSGTLYGDYQIPLPDNKFVTVAAVLDDWQFWDKKKTLDPLEPEHRNFQACGILYVRGDTPRLFTLAHGGMTFKLARQPMRVVYRKGRLSAVADALAVALSSQGDVFYSGEADLVQAFPGRFRTLDRGVMQYVLGQRVALVSIRRDPMTKKEVDIPMNIPPELVALTYAALGQKPNQTPPALQSVTSLPYATPNRRLVITPGYDRETGIYNIMTHEVVIPTDCTDRALLIAALVCLWEAWAGYKWANDAARAGMLSAIFTAVLRPAMSIAPAVFFDAPVQASGKTKAALALGSLMTGADPGITPFVDGKNQEPELSKALIAMLRSARRFSLIDNVTGLFESTVLAGLITSGRILGRLLGTTTDVNYSARVMLCATGNNATLGNDLNRRFLRCRIDTGVERPSDISHSFEPAQVALANRMQIATAVLTILQAYWQSQPVTVNGGADFHEWTKLVREPIVWLQQQGLTEEAGIGRIADPAEALGKESAESDPQSLGLRQLLEGLQAQVECNKPFQSKALHTWYAMGADSSNEAEALIREGIDNLTGGKPQTSRSLGFVLQNRRDKRVAGLRLVKVGEDRNGALWHVRRD